MSTGQRLEIDLYGGDLVATMELSDDKVRAVFDRVIRFCQEEDCLSGETLHQSDSALEEILNVMTDILDDILKFESRWV